MSGKRMKLTVSKERVEAFRPDPEHNPGAIIRVRTLTGPELAEVKALAFTFTADGEGRSSVPRMHMRALELAVKGWDGLGGIPDVNDKTRFNRWSPDLIEAVAMFVIDGCEVKEDDAKNSESASE